RGGGLEQWLRRRLAAGTAVLGPVRAEVDAGDARPGSLDHLQQPRVHLAGALKRQTAASDAGLVADDDERVPAFVPQAQALGGARQEAQLRRIVEVAAI